MASVEQHVFVVGERRDGRHGAGRKVGGVRQAERKDARVRRAGAARVRVVGAANQMHVLAHARRVRRVEHNWSGPNEAAIVRVDGGVVAGRAVVRQISSNLRQEETWVSESDAR